MLKVKKCCVIGAGQMGTGIAYVTALKAKLPVFIYDTSLAQLQRQQKFVAQLLDKDLAKGKITKQDVEQTQSLIEFCKQPSNGLPDEVAKSSADFVIEAVSENPDLKSEIFSRLMAVMPAETILATNTSSISISKIAASHRLLADAKDSSSRVIGMHFMNPVPVMKLVEIIPALQTSEDTLQQTLLLAQRMGKATTTSRDIPGFVANRLLMPYINEAVFAFMEGIATKEDIDTTMKLGTNMPMGPLTLADFIGLDTCLAIMRVLHTQLGDSKYRPCPLLIQYVDAGWHGKKSGQGFYKY